MIPSRKLTPVVQIGRHRALGARIAKSAADAEHDARRAELFGGQLGTAPEERCAPLPPKGPERDALAARLRAMKEERHLSHIQAAVELGIDMSQVSSLCTAYGIKSSTPRLGSTRVTPWLATPLTEPEEGPHAES